MSELLVAKPVMSEPMMPEPVMPEALVAEPMAEIMMTQARAPGTDMHVKGALRPDRLRQRSHRQHQSGSQTGQ
jgi:hypothetical protein